MDDGDRALREMQLENLPPNTAAAVSELASYDWQSREAREDYEKIKDLLGRELLDQRFAGMKQALENATDEDRAAINEMLGDLNELLEKRVRGEDTQEDFDEFMAKHGDFFPENPQNLDELLDAMAARAAAAQRMLNSMTAEQRAELMELSQQAFGSPALMESLSRLDSNLQSLRPGEDWDGSERMDGDEGLGLGDGTGVFQDLADLDELAEQLSQSYGGARMDDLDLDKLARQLGDDAAVSTPGRSRSSSGRCVTAAPCAAAPTATSSSPRRRCASSARRCCATWPRRCRAVRASATCAGPARPASCRAPPGSGSSATPSRGTCRAPSPTP